MKGFGCGLYHWLGERDSLKKGTVYIVIVAIQQEIKGPGVVLAMGTEVEI